MKKRILWIFTILLSWLLANTFVFAWNPYGNADLKNINLSVQDFKWYPLKVNIKQYLKNWQMIDRWSNTFDSSYFAQANFFEIIFPWWKNVILPIERIHASNTKTTNGDIPSDADLVLDMPFYLKKKIDYGQTVDIDLKPFFNKSSDKNNVFTLNTNNPYVDTAKSIWLLYNTNTITSETEFLPRKVLVKIKDTAGKIIKTQIIDVFKSWKTKIDIPDGEDFWWIDKVNFYVVWNPTEYKYWYAKWPVIVSILPDNQWANNSDVLSTNTNFDVRIKAFDAWTVKITIKNKYTNDIYDIFTYNISATKDTITKSFLVDLNKYSDGEYVIYWQTFKNGIKQQEITKNFIIDRFKPTFDDVFPIVLVPNNVNGAYITDIKTSERLKAENWLVCDNNPWLIQSVQRDEQNPYIFHITLNTNNLWQYEKRVECNLTDVGWTTNNSSFIVKRYNDDGIALWFSDINWNWITNWVSLKENIYKDKSIYAFVNNIGDGTNTTLSGANNIRAIETDWNTSLDTKKTLLLAKEWKVYKVYPNIDLFQQVSSTNNITNITYDYINNYWEVDDNGNFYKNWVKLWQKNNLMYYNIYKWSYIIEYVKNDWLYIDTAKINNFDKDLIAFDILSPWADAENSINAIWITNKWLIRYYKIDLMNKKFNKWLEVKYENSDDKDLVSGDFTLYNGKVVFIWYNWTRSVLSIIPYPQVILNNDWKEVKYLATNNIVFDKQLYENLGIKAEVRWNTLPTVSDCSSNTTKIIWTSHLAFDSNEWCNLKELNLSNEQDQNKIKPKFYYNEKGDEYTFQKKFDIYWLKYNLKKDLGKYDVTLKNQPIRYWLWFVKESDIVTKENSPWWDYIKYNKDTFKMLPKIVFYTLDDLNNSTERYFEMYKSNIKIQSLSNKNGLFYPVVIYETPYNKSNVRILWMTTTDAYITDPQTWKYILVKKIVQKKPYKIDTIPPVFFSIKSDNTDPKVGDKITISFKTTEEVNINKFNIWNVDLSSSNIQLTTSNNWVYYYELKDIVVNADMFDAKWQVILTLWWNDKANNYNEKTINLNGLRWSVSVSTLKVGKIQSNGEIDVTKLLVTKEDSLDKIQWVNIKSQKYIKTNSEIHVDFPKKDDGSIDLKKLFNNTRIIDLVDLYKNNKVKQLKQYLWNDCIYDLDDNNKIFKISGNCNFYRNRVYEISWYKLEIPSKLTYKWYTTFFVLNGDIDIKENVEKENSGKQNAMWIITNGMVNIYSTTNIVEAFIETSQTINVLK